MKAEATCENGLVVKAVPHENESNPDWGRLSDKSALERQRDMSNSHAGSEL